MLRPLLLAALVPIAACFLESHPIVVWSSHRYFADSELDLGRFDDGHLVQLSTEHRTLHISPLFSRRSS
jgi:hypothetical protein